jgi:predicted MFS family arabinose efflux permease
MLVTGASTMVALLAILDLAARSCPDKAEGTFFAALMSVFNASSIGSANVGGRLFERVGLWWLILISAAATAVCWLVVPWLQIPGPRRQTAEEAKAEEAATSV